MDAIPSHVAFINLGENNLDEIETKGLTSVLQKIPKHIITLDLGGNNLCMLDKGLPQVFQSIPSSIEELNLSNNGFDQYKISKRERLLSDLPSSIKFVTLNNERLNIQKLISENRYGSTILSAELLKCQNVFFKFKDSSNDHEPPRKKPRYK